MSGPNRSLFAQDLLKNQFAIWSLAIFGSLTSSGVVRLNHPALWAADDPPVGSTQGDSTQGDSAQGDSAQGDKRKPTETALTRAELIDLLQAQKTTEAIRMVDAAIAADPSPANYYLAYILASSLSQRQPAIAIERFQSIVDRLGERVGPKSSLQDVSTALMSSRTLASLLDRSGKSEDALRVTESALVTAEKIGARAAGLSASLLKQRCQLLVKLNREDEAKAMLEQRIDEQLAKAGAEPSAMSVSPELATYGSLFRTKFPQQVQEAYDKVERLLLAGVESENATLSDYVAYHTLQLNIADQLGQSNAQAADEVLVKLQERASKFSERIEEHENTQFERTLQTLKAARARLSARLLHESLIGQPAPEFDVETSVGMDQVQWADLKGKVVLIDFWAVWCGPCIATFPHLKHLKQQYGPRGLVIVGVTRQYGYTWDAEGKRALSKQGATLEEEIAMLAEFRKSHELEHGFIVTPSQSEFSKKFGVTGIPQAVLVDQNGVIQLIRVGSGQEKASDIEEKIRELLGVPAEAAGKAAS